MTYNLKNALHLLPLIIVVSCLLLLILLFVVGYFLQSANPLDKTSYKMVIPAGATVKEIQEILIERKILKATNHFVIITKLLGWQSQLQAGTYDFSPSDSLIKILFKLKAGRVSPPKIISVTFPEGTSIYKMSVILKNLGFSQWEKFQNLDKEGYLYPDTYLIFENASAEVLVKLMLNRFEQMVFPFWEKSKKDTKLSLPEVLTLASIIEKEASIPKERPIISSVFHNRLRIGMPLAADPTIKYVLERPTKKVYLGQLLVKSPYNTYQRKGLPPGPICNPGLESIRAAVYPAKTDYLYFVAKPDGSHIFSRTWEDHQRARQVKKPTGPR